MTGSDVCLAIDTSARAGSVALLTPKGRLLSKALGPDLAHGRELTPTIRQMLRQEGLDPLDVELLVVGLGPGSYTGVRVAAATALGFALASGCRLVGASSFAAKAFEAGKPGETLFVAGGGRGEMCTYAAFQVNELGVEEIVPHGIATWREAAGRLAEGWIVTGEDAPRLVESSGRELEIRDPSVPRAGPLLELGRILFEQRGATPVEGIKPLYLRKSSAEINWQRRQKGHRKGR